MLHSGLVRLLWEQKVGRSNRSILSLYPLMSVTINHFPNTIKKTVLHSYHIVDPSP